MCLPPELLLDVFRNLKKVDLKHVRLVSRTWQELATNLLFDRVYLTYRQKDIEVFEAWTSNPRCAAVVRELVCDVSTLNPRLRLDQYTCNLWCYIASNFRHITYFEGAQRQVKEIFHLIRTGELMDPDEEKVASIDLSPEGFVPNHDHEPVTRLLQYPIVQQGYCEYIQQAKWESHRRSVHMGTLACLRIALKIFPKLQCVRFIEKSYLEWYSDPEIEDFDPRTLKSIDVGGAPYIRSWHPLYLPPCDFEECLDMDTNNGFYDTDDDMRIEASMMKYPEEYQMIILTLFSIQKKIKNLELLCIPNTDFRMNQSGSAGIEESALNAPPTIPSIFGKLTCLRLRYTNSGYLHDGMKLKLSASLPACISECSNLTTLELSAEIGKMSFSEVFADRHVLPNLRNLELKFLSAGSMALAHFLSMRDMLSLVLEHTSLEDTTDLVEAFRRLCSVIVNIPAVSIVRMLGSVGTGKAASKAIMVLNVEPWATKPKVTWLRPPAVIREATPEHIQMGDLEGVMNQGVPKPPIHSRREALFSNGRNAIYGL